MPKRNLTDRMLKALKPARAGKHYDVGDTIVPGLAVRVSETGRRTFVLISRFPGSENPTRGKLGVYGALTLEGARTKARHWLELIRQAIDPRTEEERQRNAELRKQANTFAAVVEDFVAEKLPGERKGREVERDIRRDLLPALGRLPISEITEADILPIIKAKKAKAPAQARNLLGTAKRLFAWAKDQRVYGLAANPCAELKPAKLIGASYPMRNYSRCGGPQGACHTHMGRSIRC